MIVPAIPIAPAGSSLAPPGASAFTCGFDLRSNSCWLSASVAVSSIGPPAAFRGEQDSRDPAPRLPSARLERRAVKVEAESVVGQLQQHAAWAFSPSARSASKPAASGRVPSTGAWTMLSSSPRDSSRNASACSFSRARLPGGGRAGFRFLAQLLYLRFGLAVSGIK